MAIREVLRMASVLRGRRRRSRSSARGAARPPRGHEGNHGGQERRRARRAADRREPAHRDLRRGHNPRYPERSPCRSRCWSTQARHAHSRRRGRLGGMPFGARMRGGCALHKLRYSGFDIEGNPIERVADGSRARRAARVRPSRRHPLSATHADRRGWVQRRAVPGERSATMKGERNGKNRFIPSGHGRRARGRAALMRSLQVHRCQRQDVLSDSKCDATSAPQGDADGTTPSEREKAKARKRPRSGRREEGGRAQAAVDEIATRRPSAWRTGVPRLPPATVRNHKRRPRAHRELEMQASSRARTWNEARGADADRAHPARRRCTDVVLDRAERDALMTDSTARTRRSAPRR